MILVALLANTHVIMLGMCAYLILDFFIYFIKNKKMFLKKECKKIWISLFIEFVLLLLSALPLLGCFNANKDVGVNDIPIIVKFLNSLLLQPLVAIQDAFPIILILNEIIIAFIIIVIIAFTFIEIRYYQKKFLMFYLVILWQFLIYGFIYAGGFQRASTILLIFIFFEWNKSKPKTNINESEKKLRKICINILLITSIASAIVFVLTDITGIFSGSKKTAEFINKNISEDSTIFVGNQPEFCSSIMGYTNHVKFYYIQKEDYFTYVTYDSKNRAELNIDDFYKSIDKFNSQEKLYYIYVPFKYKFNENTKSDKEFVDSMIEQKIFKKIYKSDKPFMFYEQYIIYQIEKEQIKQNEK